MTPLARNIRRDMTVLPVSARLVRSSVLHYQRGVRVLCIHLASIVAAGTLALGPAQAITEFPLPTNNSTPHQITSARTAP
jgi:hypothetical protein